VAFFTCNYRPLVNGLSLAVERLAAGLRARGHRVLIVAPRYPGAPAAEPDCLRLPSLRVPTHHAYAVPLPWLAGGRRAVAAARPAIVHAHHPFLVGPYAARLARRLGVPLVFTHHTLYEHYGHYVPGAAALAGAIARRRAARFAARADLVVAPSPGVARRLAAEGVRAPIVTIPTGVMASPPGGGESRAALRRDLLRGAPGPLLLAVGRLAPEKNLETLLRAFALAAADAPGAALCLVGDGDDRGRLVRRAASLGVAGRVRFVGPVAPEAVGGYYAAADVFAFPSLSEAQGLVVLEALGHGLPVLAARSPAVEDLLADGVTARLVEPTPEGLAAGLRELLASPDLRARLGRAGRALAAAHPFDASVDRHVQAYRELLRAHPACGSNLSRRDATGTA
jgi:glycosyltransferase involved in cell wall biosynthesis